MKICSNYLTSVEPINPSANELHSPLSREITDADVYETRSQDALAIDGRLRAGGRYLLSISLVAAWTWDGKRLEKFSGKENVQSASLVGGCAKEGTCPARCRGRSPSPDSPKNRKTASPLASVLIATENFEFPVNTGGDC